MRKIKIGLATFDPTVGAFSSNCDKLFEMAQKLDNEKCTIGVFPEQSIQGYPPEDLVQWSSFVDQQLGHLSSLAYSLRNIDTVFIFGLSIRFHGDIYNCAAVVNGGKILGIVPKEKLPTYSIFYEGRNYVAGKAGLSGEIYGVPFGDLIFEFPFGKFAVEVCEDIWSPDGPMKRRVYSGAELIINISASPFRSGVLDTRRELISTRASDNLAIIAYANQYGGNDNLVFDGGGFVNQCGKNILEMKRWQETIETVVVDLDVVTKQRTGNTTWRTDRQLFLKENSPTKVIGCSGPNVSKENGYYQTNFVPDSKKTIDKREEYFEDLMQAMKTGLSGYFEKTGAFKKIGINLSGGKDSVLSLIVCWLFANEKYAHLVEGERKKAVKDLIHCFSMPTRFNSADTKNISKIISDELGVSFQEISIEQCFVQEVADLKKMLGGDVEVPKIAKQNIQARIRGMKLWNWCNSVSALNIQTGNMSEKGVGYTTVGGDASGGYSLIGNLPKSVGIALLKYLKGKYEFEGLKLLGITKASAELDEDQEDEKDLMPFDVLDACITLFVGEKLMPEEIYIVLRSKWTDAELRAMREDYEPELLKEWVIKFIKLFMNSVFKWVQMPQAVHLGNVDLDREAALRFPVVKSMEWLKLNLLEEMEVLKR
jgi:NAD+ synthase (glutamine-hydrolysing)